MSDSSGETQGRLLPQRHGGALLRGGVPGHRGAGGRPPSAARRLAYEGLCQGLPVIADLARGISPDGVTRVYPSQMISAFRVLAHIGLNGVTEVWTATVETRLMIRALPKLLRQHGVEDVAGFLRSLEDEVKAEYCAE